MSSRYPVEVIVLFLILSFTVISSCKTATQDESCCDCAHDSALILPLSGLVVKDRETFYIQVNKTADIFLDKTRSVDERIEEITLWSKKNAERGRYGFSYGNVLYNITVDYIPYVLMDILDRSDEPLLRLYASSYLCRFWWKVDVAEFALDRLKSEPLPGVFEDYADLLYERGYLLYNDGVWKYISNLSIVNQFGDPDLIARLRKEILPSLKNAPELLPVWLSSDGKIEGVLERSEYELSSTSRYEILEYVITPSIRQQYNQRGGFRPNDASSETTEDDD
ncbi:MAG: hypothetical protein NUW37_08055 [Planctomycetes bacterium]|nr:hypothetical protein [Planctomycetota bacterium]